MDTRVSDFLKNQRVGVLSTLDTTPVVYSAALHYSFDESLPIFYVMTERQSEKCKPLLTGEERPGAFVVGFSEEEFKTFQARGTVKLIQGDKPEAWNNYLEKFPDRIKMHASPEYVLLQFIPTFWKYTDNKTEPRTKITSNGVVFP